MINYRTKKSFLLKKIVHQLQQIKSYISTNFSLHCLSEFLLCRMTSHYEEKHRNCTLTKDIHIKYDQILTKSDSGDMQGGNGLNIFIISSREISQLLLSGAGSSGLCSLDDRLLLFRVSACFLPLKQRGGVWGSMASCARGLGFNCV